jgi:hypothetical protein
MKFHIKASQELKRPTNVKAASGLFKFARKI